MVYLNAVGGVEPFLASQTIALALQGVPGIYFNNLIGAENWQEGVERLGYNRAINREKFAYQTLTRALRDGSSTKGRVYAAYTHLLQVRRSEPLFSPLAAQTVLDLDRRVFAVVRSEGTSRLVALTNVSKDKVTLDAGTLREVLGKVEARDILSGEENPLDGRLVLSPYQSAWLK